MKDGEGSAYVPRDNSLWLADDNGRAVYEVNPTTGALKQKISGSRSRPRRSSVGVRRRGPIGQGHRGMAYDEATDTLYVFSGRAAASSVLPTAFRLKRGSGGRFKVESYQPLASGSDYTAAGWNKADGKVYVGEADSSVPTTT